jgi:hypothetical protein
MCSARDSLFGKFSAAHRNVRPFGHMTALTVHIYGRVAIEDRRGLEEASCECYATVETRFHRLFDGIGQRTATPVGPV